MTARKSSTITYRAEKMHARLRRLEAEAMDAAAFESALALEDAFADGLFEAKMLVTSRDVCSASYFAMSACGHRVWAWRLTRAGRHIGGAADAARAAIYDEMADAKARNDPDAVMAGFDRLREVTQ